MRDTKKVITFDFNFTYTRDGNLIEGNTITVCEPAFDKRDVFRKMQAYVAEAQKGMLRTFSNDQLKAEADKQQADGATAAAPGELDALFTMRMGLGIDDYTRFAEFVQTALTGNRALAFIGDQDLPIKDRLPVQTGVWMSIAEAGGMEAVDQVLAGFASFFLGTRPAKNASPTTSGATGFAPLGVVPQAS